jgi:diacylglycerol kinase (ATP)
VGWVGDRHFLNVAGFGFDAAVAQAFHRRPGRGFVSYLLSSVHCLRQYRSNTYSMELDREPRSGEYFLVAFANGREYGNGFALAQNADPSDGWLDSVLVEPASMLRQVWRMRSMLSASERPVEGIARRRVRSARLSGTGLLAHVDGEWFQPPDTVHIRVEAGALLLAAATTPAAEG